MCFTSGCVCTVISQVQYRCYSDLDTGYLAAAGDAQFVVISAATIWVRVRVQSMLILCSVSINILLYDI